MAGVRLYGEMHRFIPVYASWMGARVVEMPVGHFARRFGKSNYGMGRVFKVVLDLMVAKFLEDYLVKPIYVFGGFGMIGHRRLDCRPAERHRASAVRPHLADPDAAATCWRR